MSFLPRPRWPGIRKSGTAALTAAALLFVGACAQYPNSVFHNRTEFNRDTTWLFNLIIWVGTVVFILVEALLVWAMIKYRARPGQPDPKHVHGNTTLEIAWTAIPAVILMVIAVPTVKTIFRTQAKAGADALQIEVWGHQWWWEFRYPQFTVTRPDGKIDTLVTANEVYLPLGRKANFVLRSADVIHSFWIPALGGKRDLMANHTNYLWFTPDSATADAWNGVCVEYCGTSHANMRFRAFTVTKEDFASWAAHQLEPAKLLNAPPPVASAPGGKAAGAVVAAPPALTSPTAPGVAPVAVQSGFVAFAMEKLPAHVRPNTPIPTGLQFDESKVGNPGRGESLFTSNTAACWTCHSIRGVPKAFGSTAPNLSHIGSRTTIGAGLYPQDTKHLTAWITNARVMKPGVLMPTLGAGQIDPQTKKLGISAKLDAQQIADIVAYLQTLK